MTTGSSESDLPVCKSDTVEITQRPYDHPDAVRLVRALYDEQVARYGFADPVDADPAEYAPPHGLFLIIYSANVPSACGGYRPYDPGTSTVEVKKMYTIPDLRGEGLGRLVLFALQQHAGRHGAAGAILETGAHSHAALSLFRQAGYQPTGRYARGRDAAINRAFFKDLSDLQSSVRDDLRAIAQ